jgi:WD40 repeat protein
VVAGSLDKLVSITDAEERVPLKVLDGHTKGVTSVDWSSLYKFVCRFVATGAEGLGANGCVLSCYRHLKLLPLISS